MDDGINIQKICSACGQANKAENAYCRNCGANLEGSESVNIETEQVSDVSETNKVEITKTLKASKYGSICCIIIILGIVLGLIFLLYSAGTIQAAIGAVFLAALLLPVVVGFLIYFLFYTSKMGQARTFSISDQEIKIALPNKPVFRINWSEFTTVQLFRFAKGIIIDRPALSLNFFTNEGSKRETSIEIGREFKNSTVKKITSLIEQYANRLNKEYIWGTKKKKK